MQLLLQPCGDSDAREHYVDTIQNPVPLTRILPHLKPEERKDVAAAFPHAVAVWGVTPGKNDLNARKWRRIAVGDAALMYRDKKFFFRGTVAFKTHSPELAHELWNTRADGATWEYIFFLTDLEPVEIGIGRFNAAAGYKDNFIVQGFNVLPTDLSERILDELDLSYGLGTLLPDEHDMSSALIALQGINGDLDQSASVRRRKEQSHLRMILLGKKKSERCSICSRLLPVDLLVIGHIRKRHSCSTEQKKDLTNVMPVCLLGCDRLFENGYIHVDSGGFVRSAHRSEVDPDVSAATVPLDGLRCRAWTVASEPYFHWHRSHPRTFV